MRFQEHAAIQPEKSIARLIVTTTRSAFMGEGLILEPYSSPLASITVQLNPVASGEDRLIARGPNTLSKIQAKGEVATLFCHPTKDNHAMLNKDLAENEMETLCALLKRGPEDCSVEDFLDDIMARLGVKTGYHPRSDIELVIKEISSRPEDFPTVNHAAKLSGLSATRFQHLFTETVSMPFRKFRQLCRINQVIRALADGENLTQAAYGAGFSSSAHLSTAFKSMFGFQPSSLFNKEIEYLV